MKATEKKRVKKNNSKKNTSKRGKTNQEDPKEIKFSAFDAQHKQEEPLRSEVAHLLSHSNECSSFPANARPQLPVSNNNSQVPMSHRIDTAVTVSYPQHARQTPNKHANEFMIPSAINYS